MPTELPSCRAALEKLRSWEISGEIYVRRRVVKANLGVEFVDSSGR